MPEQIPLEAYFDNMRRIDLMNIVLEKYQQMGWIVTPLSPTSAQVTGAGNSLLLHIAFGLALCFSLIGMGVALIIIHTSKAALMIEAAPDGAVTVQGRWRKRVITNEKRVAAPNTLSHRGAVTTAVIFGIISTCLWTPVFFTTLR